MPASDTHSSVSGFGAKVMAMRRQFSMQRLAAPCQGGMCQEKGPPGRAGRAFAVSVRPEFSLPAGSSASRRSVRSCAADRRDWRRRSASTCGRRRRSSRRGPSSVSPATMTCVFAAGAAASAGAAAAAAVSTVGGVLAMSAEPAAEPARPVPPALPRPAQQPVRPARRLRRDLGDAAVELRRVGPVARSR